MGIFSSIGKFFTNVWKGITKVFEAVMKPINKLLGSKLGKILMLAVSIFTMGTALLAGAQGFMSGTGFIGKFLNGGKAFLNSLIGTKFDVAGEAGAGGAVAGADVMGPPAPEGAVDAAASVLEGTDPAAIGGIVEQGGAGSMAMGPGPTGDVMQRSVTSGGQAAGQGAMLPPGASDAAKTAELMKASTSAATGGAAEGGNWLTKAMSAAKDFAKSDTGATVIGGMMQGYGRSQEIQAYLDEKRRVGDMFEDPNDPGMRALREHDWNIDAPRGLANASNALAQRSSGSRYAPSIPFRRPAPAGG